MINSWSPKSSKRCSTALVKLPLGGLIPSDALVILGHSLECITLKNMQESRTLLGVSEHGLYLPILAISWKMNTWSNGFRAPYFQPQMLQNGPYHPYSYGSLHVYIYMYYIYELLCIYIYVTKSPHWWNDNHIKNPHGKTVPKSSILILSQVHRGPIQRTGLQTWRGKPGDVLMGYPLVI